MLPSQPVLPVAAYTTFLWLLCHPSLYKLLCGTARDGCQADLFKPQPDTSLPPLTCILTRSRQDTELRIQLFPAFLLCIHTSVPPSTSRNHLLITPSSFQWKGTAGPEPPWPNPPFPTAAAGCAGCCRCPNAASHCLPQLFCHFARLEMIIFPFPHLLCVAAFILYSWFHFCLMLPAFLNRPLLS